MFLETKEVVLLLLFVVRINGNYHEILSKFDQHDFKVSFERVEVVDFNKSIFKNVHAVTFKYNRTTPVCNITHELAVDAENHLSIVIQVYKFLSNQYRIFPLRFQIKYCDAVAFNAIGMDTATKCGNYSGCPMYKDTVYHMCNFYPDESKLPPFLPSGSYMVDIELLYKATHAQLIRGYYTIYRPLKYE